MKHQFINYITLSYFYRNAFTFLYLYMVAINVCIYEKWIKPSTLLLCLWLIWHRRVIGGLCVHWSAETQQSNDGKPPPPPQGSHHWVNGVNVACIGEKKQKFWWLQPQKCRFEIGGAISTPSWLQNDQKHLIYLITDKHVGSILALAVDFAEIVPVWMIHRNSYFAGKNLQVCN